MSQTVPTAEPYAPFTLNICSLSLTDEQFLRLCAENPEMQLELNAQGELVILPPTGAKTGLRHNELSYTLTGWAKADGTGLAFASSTLLLFPMEPDALRMLRGSDENGGRY